MSNRFWQPSVVARERELVVDGRTPSDIARTLAREFPDEATPSANAIGNHRRRYGDAWRAELEERERTTNEQMTMQSAGDADYRRGFRRAIDVALVAWREELDDGAE